MFGVVNVMAVAQRHIPAPPIEQIIMGFDADVGRPGDNPPAKALIFVKTPAGKRQNSAGFDALRQGSYKILPLLCAGDVMNHAEQHHQIIKAAVRRVLDDVAFFECRIWQVFECGAGVFQQRRIIVHTMIVQIFRPEMFRQENTETPIAAADIQHGKRRLEVWQKRIPARPGLPACLVKFIGGHAVKFAVDGVQAVNGGIVHCAKFYFTVELAERLLIGGIIHMVIIKRIRVGSAFRVGLLVGAVVATITGLLVVAFQGLFLGAIMSFLTLNSQSGNFSSSGESAFATFSLITLCIFYAMYVVFSAIFGGISAAITAFAYNLAAGWIGGLEIELESQGKNKRGVDDIFE
jgi:Transmembrane domain of unknown function (DUF3566)